jgi:2-polyprenyl-3-methyl-5-hydroxy-6-metoxy-1,4-benzoquinol methylase
MRLDHLELHLRHERTNWWFTARERILLDVMRREVPSVRASIDAAHDARTADNARVRLLDIGCGGGGFLETVSRFGNVTGLDASIDAVAFARTRGITVLLGQLPHDVPLGNGAFDVVTMLDVLEHIENDRAALHSAMNLLVPGGFVVITVPAYPFLWSFHDTVNGHKRRYTRGELGERLAECGLVVRKLSYFNSFLFPPIAAVRVLRKLTGQRQTADSPVVPRPANFVLDQVFGAERWLLRRASLPFGVSILALAQKPAMPDTSLS